ncbi:MAG: hypothetical protein GWP91_01445, partial [Rhodobacterales bacterium]|nr:hypothetical protein [Rhodobacterales bacterium]
MNAMLRRFSTDTQATLSSAVLWREAARTSRQWQTYAIRMGFSGAMISAMLAAVWVSVNAPGIDHANLAWLGRGLFIGMATIQFGMALMLAPLLSASALIEEAESGTLDMLVLTKLTPSQIATAKVFSRVLMLLTVAFGAMPIMAAVVTLGGVSAVEVVTVSVHTGLGIVIAGAMGGLFSLFTRSPLLAMFAAAAYAIPCYLILPVMYAGLILDPSGFSHLSPLGGPVATGWAALLPIPAFIPVLWMIWHIGTDLFALRTSRAHIRRAFSGEVWHTRKALVGAGIWAAVGFILVPSAGSFVWVLTAAKSTGYGLIAVSKILLWLWSTVGLWFATWMYLRLAVDIVDAIDRTFATPTRKKKSNPLKIWSNPVAWRESRPRAWGASAVPIQFTWLIGLLLLSQSTLWMIPGGLVALGFLNASAAVVLTLWLATWSIEAERRDQSLQVLLTTTMPAWKITIGKMLGIALPTLPLILLSLPMLALGTPYAHAVFGSEDHVINAFGMGIAAWAWVVPTWL